MVFPFDGHDFDAFPELSNFQLSNGGVWFSPHYQITSSFWGFVDRVVDGDTVVLSHPLRDFVFSVRLIGINAPELSEVGGDASRDYLKGLVEGHLVYVFVDPVQRVGKYGRLLGRLFVDGVDVNSHMVDSGYARLFDFRHDGEIPLFEEVIKGVDI